jgi:hypothetical protein
MNFYLNNLIKNPMKFTKDINLLKNSIKQLETEILNIEISLDNNKLNILNGRTWFFCIINKKI